ncbi:MAG TPA: fused MFS/spermidine synthase [Patescibacteria group bacterium]|nr:fused MFS/spermidine synthase [Patescibacteria group bacterium]
MKHGYLYLCISVSGASILAVEILGTRILGPFYGVSLYLWSALITVTLAALSVGYALGGRLADRGATASRLGVLLGGAGVWLLIVAWIQGPILGAFEPIGLRTAVLSAAVILFFPPLMLLGMVSPYAIKLRTGSLSEVGRSAGNLYAISTVASVAAALLTGFVLVPHVGITRLMTAIGVLLIATAALMALQGRRAAARLLVPLAVLACGMVPTMFLPGESTGATRGLVHEVQSPYGEIRVVDRYGGRFLLIDGFIHTEVEPGTWRATSGYVNVIDISRRFFDSPGWCLLVGLGGGSIAKQFARDGWKVAAVEIDPAVTDVAYRFFGLDRAEAAVVHMDGRRFLATTGELFDIIVLDAFGSSSIPFHLITREAFALAATRLAPNGLLALNVIAHGWNDLIIRSVAATLRTQFPYVWALPIAEPPVEVGNVILFASRRPIELPYELPPPEQRNSAEYDRVHAWDNRFEPDTDGAPVLTDDRNPVDLWADAINLAVRGKLHEYFGAETENR